MCHAPPSSIQEIVSPLSRSLLAAIPQGHSEFSRLEFHVQAEHRKAVVRRMGHHASHAVTFFTIRLFLLPANALTWRRKSRISSARKRCVNALSSLNSAEGDQHRHGHSHVTLKLRLIA